MILGGRCLCYSPFELSVGKHLVFQKGRLALEDEYKVPQANLSGVCHREGGEGEQESDKSVMSEGTGLRHKP